MLRHYGKLPEKRPLLSKYVYIYLHLSAFFDLNRADKRHKSVFSPLKPRKITHKARDSQKRGFHSLIKAF